MTKTTFPRMHTSFYVGDLQKSMDFYSLFFGDEPAKIKSDYAKYELENPALTISFLQSPEKVQARFGHLGIQVNTQEELKAWHKRVKAGGLSTLEEIGTSCCYAVQDKFWVADPDGVQWEIYFFHEDSEWNDPRYKGTNSMEEKDIAKDSPSVSCC